MFILIGGPPKCGKTTASKRLSRQLNIPWVSSDALQVVSRQYVSKYESKAEMKRLYPHSASKGKTNDETYSRHTPKQIAAKYIQQANSCHLAIDMFIASEIADGNDYIIEGYHVTPTLVAALKKKYGRNNIKAVFLYQKNIDDIEQALTKSTTPNDWVIEKTKREETLTKIAEMISYYSEYFVKEARKYGFKAMRMDGNFPAQIRKVVKLFSRK